MPYYNKEAKELRKTKEEWRESRTEKSVIGFNSTSVQKVPLGECSRFIKDYYKLRRNMDGNLEINGQRPTEALKTEIWVMLNNEFGVVTRYSIDKILEGAKLSEHIPYDPFPGHGFVYGVKYRRLFEENGISLYQCEDGIYRIRTYKNNFLGTTEIKTGVTDAIDKYNEVSKLFGINKTISYYNLEH